MCPYFVLTVTYRNLHGLSNRGHCCREDRTAHSTTQRDNNIAVTILVYHGIEPLPAPCKGIMRHSTYSIEDIMLLTLSAARYSGSRYLWSSEVLGRPVVVKRSWSGYARQICLVSTARCLGVEVQFYPEIEVMDSLLFPDIHCTCHVRLDCGLCSHCQRLGLTSGGPPTQGEEEALTLACRCTRKPWMSQVALCRSVWSRQILSRCLPTVILRYHEYVNPPFS